MKKFRLTKPVLKSKEQKAFEKLSVKMLTQIRGGYEG